MPDGITIGDIIGYIISLGVGFLAGNKYANRSNVKTIQKNNSVKNGDVVGGDKIGR